MTQSKQSHTIHQGHSHSHGPNCGHKAVKHNDHTDYLHEGHLHRMHESHVDEHTLEVTTSNPSQCTPQHVCSGHTKDHRHGVNCGHESIPHDDHIDYIVEGHLHHSHTDHCDDHGKISFQL